MAEGNGDGGFLKSWRDKVTNTDWADKAREQVNKARDQVSGIQIPEGAKDAVTGVVNGVVQEGTKQVESWRGKAQNGDWKGLAQDAGKIVKENQGGIVGMATGALFPQAAILGKGTDMIGGFVGKREGKRLLGDPADLGSRMVANFDSIDTNKNNFIEGADLKEGGGLSGLLSDNRGILPVLDKGFSKFANFDGLDADKGVSRADIDLFAMVYNKDAVAKAVNEDAWSGAKIGSALGVVGGLGTVAAIKYLLRPQSLAAVAVPSIAVALAAPVVGYQMKQNSSESFYSQKQRDADQLVDWLKQNM